MATLSDLNKIIPPSLLKTTGVPSLSIALLQNNTITTHVLTTGPENPQTIYQACSISKPLTALACARLIDQGHFTYTTLVADHIPSTLLSSITGPTDVDLWRYVTLEMVLSHTSGLSQHFFPGHTGDVLPGVEDVLAGRGRANTAPVCFESWPGTRFSYSGGGYVVVQLFLESVLGKSFEVLMREVVFEPLGMTRSHFGDLEKSERNYADGHLTGSAKLGADGGYHRFVEMAAAGLWTTPEDLMKSVLAIQLSLEGHEGAFLQRATAELMVTRLGLATEDKPIARGYFADGDAFGHAGDNWPGYTCYHFGSMGGGEGKERYGVALMTNSLVGNTAYTRVLWAIYYLLGWDRPEKLPCAWDLKLAVPYAAPEGTVVGDRWRRWVGCWEGMWRVVDEGGPRLAFGDAPSLRLRPAAAPVRKEEGFEEMVFVVEGLWTAVRLICRGGEREVEVWAEQGSLKTLKKRT